MSTLTLTPNIKGGDDFYEELLGAHDGLSKDESDSYNARLILILANHIGTREVLSEAIIAAKRIK
ncbi:DUF2783 domain-containing protein [Lentibacter sp.]|uniref:DUF2783 domain-containing protein n=1 Tax=Lentibacter sp. TaxID=2024994 RepID=UPI003F6A3821